MKKEKNDQPKKDKKNQKDEEVIFLEDLAPREDVRGGNRKLIFGEPMDPPEEDDPASDVNKKK